MTLSAEVYATIRYGRRALASAVGITGADGPSRTRWIHVAPEGTWSGHSEGEFSLTGEHFRSCIADANRRVTPQSLDYEHASIRPTGEPTPAAGFVQRLELRSDGLWALVELTKRAFEFVRDGEYRFCSGVFLFNEPDRVTGEVIPCVLDTIALTNRPFVDGQSPITLSRSTRALSTGVPTMKITREALATALDSLEGEELTAEQITNVVEGLAKIAAAATPAEAEEVAEVAAEEADLTVALAPEVVEGEAVEVVEAEGEGGDHVAALLAKLTEATGMDEAALVAALLASAESIAGMLKGTGDSLPGAALAVRALSESLTAARSRLARYEAADKAAADRKIEAEVDGLIQAGKLHPSKRTEVRALAVKSPASFRTLANALVPVFPVGRHATALTAPTGGTMTVTDTVIDSADPRVVALSAELDRAGVTDPAIRNRNIAAALKA